MQNIEFQILISGTLDEYKNFIKEKDLQSYFDKLKDSEISVDTFSFYTSVAAVFSSKIEGENIELDSYVKHKRFGIEFLPDYTRKIDDLYNTYQFAKESLLTEKNILLAHKNLTKNLLPENRQGQVRTGNMYVTTSDGKIEYVAASPFVGKEELSKFYMDMDLLLKTDLSITEIFYFASMLHLVFAKIHLFDDGNGRTSRLIEKWFLATKLGPKAWFLQSEKNYYIQHQTYYNHIRRLGIEYDQLNYEKALPFLLMLPQSLNTMN
ncbi:Fic family protein [Dyadobacter sp. CY356]|uniref:Fic family protein n=1 Tax=Dyadobacter sp. CY356 TaxID=2906442 RepID=UPI001F4845BC|nr:Fic family protein [Dyadobacter sp. CY356]MCF0056598.1 Fic family protein [Dyadobacter sp. CY356]